MTMTKDAAVGADKQAWAPVVYQLLRESGVQIFPFVPDAGNSELISLAQDDPDAVTVALTTEEEGVAVCAGADLGGARAALLIQGSGIGNCVNFFGLTKGARFPLLMIVSMRGEFGEQNPWQYPMGQAVEPVLEAMDILRYRVARSDELVPAVTAAVRAAYVGGNGVAVLLSQRFLGAKTL